jgi:hypothetical protein
VIPQSSAATLVVAAGARAAEARLLAGVRAFLELRDAALDAALAAGDASAARHLLERPLRIVVPSGSLRDHVSACVSHFERCSRRCPCTQWALALAVTGTPT